jgi:hypothetical protein
MQLRSPSIWHIKCFPNAALRDQPGERDTMESATQESHEIQYDKSTFRAAVCHRCGAKMFPVELLEAHMDRHELKDMYLQGELKKLQYSMNRMR